MPAESQAQQQAAATAHAVRRGDAPMTSLRGASKQMYRSMTIEELHKIASTKHKGLPEKKGK
jgi:hypothetical protein